MKRITITVNNLNFSVHVYDKRLEHIIKFVCDKLTTHTLVYNKHSRRYYKQEDKSFYTYDNREKCYRFPITIIKNFMLTLSEYKLGKDDIEIIRSEDPNYHTLNVKWNKKFILRDYQEDYIKAFFNNMQKKILLVDAPVGSGKGLIAAGIEHKLNFRIGCLLLPKYVKKWVDEFKLYLNMEDEDICVVQGEESLVDLMEDEDITYKVIIFSIPTIINYLRDYENGSKLLPIRPYELFQKLGIGLIYNDETHNHFHAVTRAICYFDAKAMICSTATLDSNQSDMKKLYKTVVPDDNRISNLVSRDPYVTTVPIMYYLQMNKSIKYKRAKGYNHILFEQSIMRNSIFLNNYFKMIKYYMEYLYFKRRAKEDKIAIFFASIDMCKIFTNYLKREYPKEDIYRYIGGDDYNTMLNSQIIVTNHSMLGTGIDIKNLTTVIQTVSASSLQANVQNFGRLRKIEGKEVMYAYLYTRAIPNQYKMHLDRYHAIADKSKEVLYMEYPVEVKTY